MSCNSKNNYITFVDREFDLPNCKKKSTTLNKKLIYKDINESEDVVCYLHIPFCKQKCVFCFFNTKIKPTNSELSLYTDKLIAEIIEKCEFFNYRKNVLAVHFGGGTPLELGLDNLRNLVTILSKRFKFSNNIELSIEIDPANTSESEIRDLQTIGFNRFSFGVQSFNEDFFLHADRKKPQEINKLLTQLDNKTLINIDLIAGFPKINDAIILDDVKRSIDLDPNIITIYPLALKKTSKLFKKFISKEYDSPNWSELESILCSVDDYLSRNNFKRKTLWAYTKENVKSHSKYEQLSWKGYDCIGFGISAYSHIGNNSFINYFSKGGTGIYDYEISSFMKMNHEEILARLVCSVTRFTRFNFCDINPSLKISKDQIIKLLEELNLNDLFIYNDNNLEWIEPSVLVFKNIICDKVITAIQKNKRFNQFWYVP